MVSGAYAPLSGSNKELAWFRLTEATPPLRFGRSFTTFRKKGLGDGDRLPPHWSFFLNAVKDLLSLHPVDDGSLRESAKLVSTCRPSRDRHEASASLMTTEICKTF